MAIQFISDIWLGFVLFYIAVKNQVSRSEPSVIISPINKTKTLNSEQA